MLPFARYGRALIAFAALLGLLLATDPARAQSPGSVIPARAVSIDAADNIVVVGDYEGEDLQVGLRASRGGRDAFAVKYDTSGNLLWAKSFGETGDQIAYGVGTDAQNDAYVAGAFEGRLTLSSGTLTSAGADDIFVLKLAP